MSSEHKIGTHEFFALLSIVISGKVFLSTPRNIVLHGGAAGWMIVIGAAILALGGFYFICDLLRRFPGQNIIAIARLIVGAWPGAVIGVIIFIVFLMTTSLLLRQFAESFILAILPHTPIGVLTLPFLFLLTYSAWLGMETLSRLGWFFGPYLLLALLTILAFSLPQAHLQFLTPVFGLGPVALVKSVLLHLAPFANLLLLGIFAPLIRRRGKIPHIGVGSILVALALFLLTTLVTILVFSFKNTDELIFPILQLARIISLERFFQRIEALFVFLWFFTAGLQLGALFQAAVTSFSETFRIKNARPLIFPIVVIIFTLSLLPSSMTEAVLLEDFIFGKYYAAVAFGIPFLLWFTNLMLPKKTRRENQ